MTCLARETHGYIDTVQILHTLGIEDTDTHRVKYLGYRYSSPLSIRKTDTVSGYTADLAILILAKQSRARAVRHLPRSQVLMRGPGGSCTLHVVRRVRIRAWRASA